MKDYPEWDDFYRDAWKSFSDKAYREAFALKAGKAVVTYMDVKRTVEALWERWLNNSESRRRIFLEAKNDLISEILLDLQKDPTVSVPPEPQNGWVTEADRANRYYWPLTKKVMVEEMGEAVADAVDRQSETVLRHLHDPREDGVWKVRGLVIGSIQAGKTANYSALIAKAADAGYRLIIVLAGIHNDLRRQTQERLDHDFTGFSSTEDGKTWRTGVGLRSGYDVARQPQSATDLDRDFEGGTVTMESKPWLIVMKKEKHRLENFVGWLKNQMRSKPVLLIDDEADQASMNTLAKTFEEGVENGSQNSDDARQEATRINSLIRQIIKLSPRCSYVGYTASPFANLFVDASIDSEDLGEDLYPKDFIVQIPAPANYFGPKEYFDPDSHEESALFIPFPTVEAQSWLDKDEVGELPKTARACLLQFVVSSAIKAWRADRVGRLDESAPAASSMLVHVSHLIDVQKKLAAQISEELLHIRRSILFGADIVDAALRSIFDAQREKTLIVRDARDAVDRKKDWALPNSFEELIPWIERIALSISVLVINGEAKPDRKGLLQAEAGADKRLRPVVWVGGNKLSRGLTIPSLCMSIFLRATGAADTLLQMGRWFGYRDGYADLCRISTTVQLADRFMKISSSLEDLSEQVGAMSNQLKTPSEYRLVVQQHPGFQLTSASKMRTAVDVACCFAGYRTELRYFLLSRSVPHMNFMTARKFMQEILEKGSLSYDSNSAELSVEAQPIWIEGRERPSGCLWRGVPSTVVMNFFRSYITAAGCGEDDPELRRMLRYILKENQEGRLRLWNIWVPRGANAEQYKTLADGDFAPLERSGKRDGVVDGDRFRLSSLQSEGDQFIGVRKNIVDAAKAELEKSGTSAKRGEFFRLVRLLAAQKQVAGDHAFEGYMRLYSIRSDALTSSEWGKTADGERLPLISYALWMPGSMSVRGRTNATLSVRT